MLRLASLVIVLASFSALASCSFSGGESTPLEPDAAPSADAPASDTDNDGVVNADDNCPEVPNELQENSDNDAFGDACDNCINTDNEGQENSDGDDLGDACDNCPELASKDLADEDGDGLGNACDNCPTRDAPQTDADADGVGDACDPGAGDHAIVFADFFEDDVLDPLWTIPNVPAVSQDGWALSANGTVVQSSQDNTVRYLVREDLDILDGVVEVNYRVLGFDDGFALNAAGAVGRYDSSTDGSNNQGVGYTCTQSRRLNVASVKEDVIATIDVDTSSGFIAGVGPALLPTVDYRSSLVLAGDSIDCVRDNGTDEDSVGSATFVPSHPAGGVGLRTFGAAAEFHSIVVYALE